VDKGEPAKSTVRWAAALVAATVLLGLLYLRPPSELWRDIPFILAVATLWFAIRGRSSVEPALAAAGFILGMYVYGQLPLIFGVLGLRP
jgi:hypothetical protein